MEIFGICTLCEKEDDLIRVQSTKEVWKTEDGESIKDKVTEANICNNCHNKYDGYRMRGWTKAKALLAVMKEVSDGKK